MNPRPTTIDRLLVAYPHLSGEHPSSTSSVRAATMRVERRFIPGIMPAMTDPDAEARAARWTAAGVAFARKKTLPHAGQCPFSWAFHSQGEAFKNRLKPI